MSTEKKQDVVRAGTSVFFRQGYKRTTMADIAKEAGVSRPALYQLFENKDAIFKAAVRIHADEVLSRIRQEITDSQDPKDQLAIAFEHYTVTAFEMSRHTPFTKDVTTARLELAGHELSKASERLSVLLSDLLKRAATTSITDSQCLDLAKMMLASSCGFRHSADDVDELRGLLNTLVHTTVASIKHPAAS